MRRSTGLTRALWRFTALLQLLLPTVVSIADAKLERDATSARAFSHVEANTSKDCVRVHTSECALCQHLTTPLAKSNKAALPALVAHAEQPAITLGAGAIVAPDQSPTLPRAPPAV